MSETAQHQRKAAGQTLGLQSRHRLDPDLSCLHMLQCRVQA